MARIVVLATGFMAICALSFSPAGAASLSPAPPPSDCSDIVSALMDCFSYVTNDSTTPCPSRSCCAGVADVVTESPECICQTLQEANDLGVAVNMTRALDLPAACSVKAPKIHCDASSPSAAPPSPPRPSPGPSPSPRPSPVPSPTPRPSPVPSPNPRPSPVLSPPPTTPPSPPPATPSPTPATPLPNSAVTPSPTPASAPMSSEAPRLASVVVAIAGLASAIFYQIHFC
nr:PREDICTED: non-specific lipid-transfer protein-like protein At2g13820 isoform X1 [Musa acuminata subsp. malaccensis]